MKLNLLNIEGPAVQRWVLATLLALLAACTQPDNQQQSGEADIQDATVSDISIIHGESPNEYVINWKTQPENAQVKIEWSSNPDFTVGEGEHIVETNQQTLNWTANGSHTRRYFILSTQSGAFAKTSVRLLPLEGGRNFRDLGGYQTVDGRTVKWGHIFRSGVMHELTGNDYSYLADLGIKSICDFRDARERDEEPTLWKAGDVDYKFFADPPERDPRENPMFAALLDPESSSEDIKLAMAKGYSDIAKSEIEGYTAMFKELSAGRVPLAFNCSAGKDRAGTAAALILTALGVPEDTVVFDYSLSDKYVDYMEAFMSPEKRAKAESQPNHPYAFLFKLPVEKVEPLLASDPLYIQTSFADLKAEYGTVLNFIQTELKVSDSDLTSMRETLLY